MTSEAVTAVAPSSSPRSRGDDAGGPLLDLTDVTRDFRVKVGAMPWGPFANLRAVDKVTMSVQPGETFGIVGESGSGKSTLGRLALRLLEPTSGTIRFDGRDITRLRGNRLRQLRNDMQMVFQDPLGSLNPRMKIKTIIGEPLRVFRGMGGKELSDRVAELLNSVGLSTDRGESYPRELSGGQRQRVGIARAIALDPKMILADEAVSALDVSVQAQVINLFAELRDKLGLTYLFIAHGLPVVRQISQRVGVMYLGRMVETGPSDELFSAPAHPYTKALLDAAPSPDPSRRGNRVLLKGEPPSPMNLPSGCRFRSRCPFAQQICAEVDPPDIDLGGGRTSACHFAGDLAM